MSFDHQEKKKHILETTPMSLSRNPRLLRVARSLCRDLRKKMTASERLFWDLVRDRRFLGRKFYRQHPLFVEDQGRETFFIADFFCYEERLVVEIDGKMHDYSKRRDRLRTNVLREYGLRVIRFRNDELLKDMPFVMSQLKEEFGTRK
jgi:very-short-patch-repair endonuclease